MQDGTQDIDLWRRLKNGERTAFELIYQNQINDLINYGRRFTSDIELIEDSVHDVFVYIWSRRDTLSETDSIKKYLLVSLRNKLIKTFEKNKKTVYGETSDAIFGSEESIEDEIAQKEDKIEKAKMLEGSYHILSNRQKEAIFLKFNNEHSYEDICKIMDISYQSARNLISSGLKKLHNEIKKKKLE